MPSAKVLAQRSSRIASGAGASLIAAPPSFLSSTGRASTWMPMRSGTIMTKNTSV